VIKTSIDRLLGKNFNFKFLIFKQFSMSKSKILLVASLIVLFSAGCVAKKPINEVKAPVETKSEQKEAQSKPEVKAEPKKEVEDNSVKYVGENGKTALELLKAKYKVETKTFSGIGEYVTAINGIKETTGKNFWAFYVNGKQAKVGASDYKTQNTEQIEWKLEEISAFKN
jgi:hypothetical protein